MVLQGTSIELLFPARDHQGGDGVANHVDDGAAHAKKAIDAKNQSHSCNWNGWNDHHRSHECDKGGSLHAAGALGSEKSNAQDGELLEQIEMCVCGLSHEKGGESHIQAGAVGVERVTGGDNEPDKRFGAAEFFELGHE